MFLLYFKVKSIIIRNEKLPRYKIHKRAYTNKNHEDNGYACIESWLGLKNVYDISGGHSNWRFFESCLYILAVGQKRVFETP
jgi:hypothetical protein